MSILAFISGLLIVYRCDEVSVSESRSGYLRPHAVGEHGRCWSRFLMRSVPCETSERLLADGHGKLTLPAEKIAHSNFRSSVLGNEFRSPFLRKRHAAVAGA